jgi:single-stranded DNA-binding protein
MSIEAAFVGVLGRDAQVRVSKTDKKFLQFNVAVGSGERAQWVAAMSFDVAVVELAGTLVKGARVYCEGRLTLGEWTGKDGAARQGLSVLATHVRVSEIGESKTKPKPKRKQLRSKPRSSADKGGGFFDDPIPF